MLQLKNATPFPAQLAVLPDINCVDTVVVVVKATFEIGAALRVADEQAEVVLGDEYWGEPDVSSLRYAGELHLPKPSTDVVLVGSAQAPGRRPVQQLDVELRVAEVSKSVRVFGERRWTGRRLGAAFTPPERFETMPLVYERAFGGTHVDEGSGKVYYEPRNPIGRGYSGGRGLGDLRDRPLPNLEDPARPVRGPRSKSAPSGFGFIAPSWEPRRRRAGTYDDTWQRTRAPFLPRDFQPLFFNAAHPDLVCPEHLRGGEPVMATNAWSQGPLAFTLPVCDFDLGISIRGETTRPEVALETVLIEPDASRLCLVWRAAVPCDKSVLQVERVDVGLRRLEIDGSTQ
jgi:hypothetical protein